MLCSKRVLNDIFTLLYPRVKVLYTWGILSIFSKTQCAMAFSTYETHY